MSAPTKQHNPEEAFQRAPVAPGDWVPGMPLRVECSACSHEWTYSGQTQYAQCKCGKSNPVLGGHDE